jgi:hypothetical protein
LQYLPSMHLQLMLGEEGFEKKVVIGLLLKKQLAFA